MIKSQKKHYVFNKIYSTKYNPFSVAKMQKCEVTITLTFKLSMLSITQCLVTGHF